MEVVTAERGEMGEMEKVKVKAKEEKGTEKETEKERVKEEKEKEKERVTATVMVTVMEKGKEEMVAMVMAVKEGLRLHVLYLLNLYCQSFVALNFRDNCFLKHLIYS